VDSKQYLETLREALTHLCNESAGLTMSHGGEPSEDSQLANELASFADPELIYHACYLGTTLIDFGGEHISAFVKLLAEPIEILASWTCVRSMLESCSLAAWMLDPTIDARLRAGRVFTLRYEEMSQQATLLRTVQNDPPALHKLVARIEAVEQQAVSMGYPRALDKKGKRVGFVEKMPTATEMIRMMLNDEWSYRLLSAVAHGHTWAIRGLGWSQFGPEFKVGNVTLKQLEKSVNPHAIAIMGLSAAKAFVRPVWNQCRFYGWNALQFEEVFENVFDKMATKDNQRFWRT
jgi:hypothetical protein